MAVLLPEIWTQICLLLDKGDLSALSRTGRCYHEIAAPFLYRSLRIQFRDPDTLWEAVHEILNNPRAGKLFCQHARRLDLVCLKPSSPGTEKGEQLWKSRDWGMEYVHWQHLATIGDAFLEPQLRSSTCVAGLGFPIDELGTYPSTDWEAVTELISRIRRLDEFNFVAKAAAFEPALLDAINEHHPGCCVNICALQHVERSVIPADEASVGRFDLNALHSRNVRTLGVAISRKYANYGGAQYVADLIPFLVNPPNLKHLIIHAPWERPDEIDRCIPGWETVSRDTPTTSSARMESLTLLDMGRSISLLPELADAADLTLLKSLDLALDQETHHVVNLAPDLVSLERLFIGVSPLRLSDDPYASEFDPHVDSGVAVSAILAFRPLRYLCIRGLREVSNLHRILAYHGQTLHGLSLEPYVWDHSRGGIDGCYKYPQLTPSDIVQVATSCPSLEELRLQIRRSEGNGAECNLYKAFGHLQNLRTLILDLHFDPRDRPAHPDSLRLRSPHPDATDEDEEIDPGVFRTTLINAATDESLARAIWNIVAAAQPHQSHQPPRRLRNLRIVPFGFDLYTPDEIYFLIFLARSFLVSRVGRGDPVVREIGRMAWTVWQEDAYGPGDPCLLPLGADEVVAALWPALSGRGEWSSGWASFPLDSGDD
ncbi:hypothetical protein BJY00DRAFT_309826 [Aspergillus carlsbadensis]|nr:hypothetical protein BJY00DRAFT_309826 [Aspergillus carlsbadensis]